MNYEMPMVEMGQYSQYYDTYIMIHNAAILTLQIPIDSMHHCVSIPTEFVQCMHDRLENIFAKIM